MWHIPQKNLTLFHHQDGSAKIGGGFGMKTQNAKGNFSSDLTKLAQVSALGGNGIPGATPGPIRIPEGTKNTALNRQFGYGSLFDKTMSSSQMPFQKQPVQDSLTMGLNSNQRNKFMTSSMSSGLGSAMTSAKIGIKGWTPMSAKPSSPFTHMFDNSIFRRPIPPPPMKATSGSRRASLLVMKLATAETELEIVEKPTELETAKTPMPLRTEPETQAPEQFTIEANQGPDNILIQNELHFYKDCEMTYQNLVKALEKKHGSDYKPGPGVDRQSILLSELPPADDKNETNGTFRFLKPGSRINVEPYFQIAVVKDRDYWSYPSSINGTTQVRAVEGQLVQIIDRNMAQALESSNKDKQLQWILNSEDGTKTELVDRGIIMSRKMTKEGDEAIRVIDFIHNSNESYNEYYLDEEEMLDPSISRDPILNQPIYIKKNGKMMAKYRVEGDVNQVYFSRTDNFDFYDKCSSYLDLTITDPNVKYEFNIPAYFNTDIVLLSGNLTIPKLSNSSGKNLVEKQCAFLEASHNHQTLKIESASPNVRLIVLGSFGGSERHFHEGPWKTEDDEEEEFQRMKQAGKFPNFTNDDLIQIKEENFDIIDRINESKMDLDQKSAQKDDDQTD